MIAIRRVNSTHELTQFFRGTPVASGSAGTNSAGSPNLQDLTADAFADVEVGDRIYISGELAATVFLVDTKTDANNLILDTAIVAVHAAGPTEAVWRTTRGGIDPDDMVFAPMPDSLKQDSYILVYEVSDFGV